VAFLVVDAFADELLRGHLFAGIFPGRFHGITSAGPSRAVSV
jgi:hypothetical protein